MYLFASGPDRPRHEVKRLLFAFWAATLSVAAQAKPDEEAVHQLPQAFSDAMSKECSTKSGSGRFGVELRIPLPEHVLQLVIQHFGSGLQQQVRATERPTHLLFLNETPAHHLIDR